jgi:hypothetical protein
VEQERLKRRLHKTLDEYFNEQELRTLCFDLGLDYDSLGDDGKSARARELVAYHWRRGALMGLTQRVEALRPLARYAEYFREILRDSSELTQEIDIMELRRMRNTGPMSVDLNTILLLNDKVDRLRVMFYAFITLIVVLQLILFLFLLVR